MKSNIKPTTAHVLTHEGQPAYPHLTPLQQLRRSVLACLLFEKEFYEDGASIAARIQMYADQVTAEELAALAYEARTVHNLRHVPLLLLTALAKRGGRIVGDTIAATIQRADELAEFLAIYGVPQKHRKQELPQTKLSKQVKLGLARAFRRFDEYQLAKYDRAGAVRLRDVLFLVRAKPVDEAQAALWERLANQELATPDTWEVQLSAGADKRETFERLLTEDKLGYLATLRNLRNMVQAGVNVDLVRAAILARKGAHRVLPFRFIAAARAAPQFEPFLDQALSESIAERPPLAGKTLVLVDVSGSMQVALSTKSDMTRMDAAAALASVLHGDLRVFSFSNHLVEVAPRRGMAGVDAIVKSQPAGGTALAAAIQQANQVPHDRLIVVTDEQATDGRVPDPVVKRAYMINVASYRNGVGYGRWTHLDGFSEGIIRYIHAIEAEAAKEAEGAEPG